MKEIKKAQTQLVQTSQFSDVSVAASSVFSYQETQIQVGQKMAQPYQGSLADLDKKVNRTSQPKI